MKCAAEMCQQRATWRYDVAHTFDIMLCDAHRAVWREMQASWDKTIAQLDELRGSTS